MLTKVSEEEQERGLAIAPPHEARSRSGGSWGSSNPGADMAGCEPTCARVKLAVAQPAAALPFEAKRGQSKRAGRRRHAATMRGSLKRRERAGRRRRHGTGSNGRRARRRTTTLLECAWRLDPPPPEAQAVGPAVGVRGDAGRRCRVATGDAVGGRGGGEWTPMWIAAIIVGGWRRDPQHTWTPSSLRCFAGRSGDYLRLPRGRRRPREYTVTASQPEPQMLALTVASDQIPTAEQTADWDTRSDEGGGSYCLVSRLVVSTSTYRTHHKH